jgi:hypothetical protein
MTTVAPFRQFKLSQGRVVMGEMHCLHCTRVPHPPYSPDLTTCDFSIFGDWKVQLAGVHMQSHEGLAGKVSKIFRAFTHWIEPCEWVAEHHGNYDNPSESDGRLIQI